MTYVFTLWTRCPVCHIPLDAELASYDVHSQASDPLVDEPLLRYYAQEWDRYTTGANYVNRLFTYLNRHWVKREKDEGRKNVYAVYIVRRLSPPQIRVDILLAVGSRAMEGQLLPSCAEQEHQARERHSQTD